MKIDVWDIRARYDGYICSQVQSWLKGRPETDVLAVVDDVYRTLEKAKELRAVHGEDSLKAFIRRTVYRRCVDRWRKWSSKKAPRPPEEQMTRVDLVASEASGRRKGSGRKTQELESFSGTGSSDGGNIEWTPKKEGLASSKDFHKLAANEAWDEMTRLAKGRDGPGEVQGAGYYGPDPAVTYEQVAMGEDVNDLESLAVKYRVKLYYPELLRDAMDGLSIREIAEKHSLPERQVRHNIDNDKRRLAAKIKLRAKK